MQKRAYFFSLLLPGVLAACRASDSTTDRAESAVQKTTPGKLPTDSGASNPSTPEVQADASTALADTGMAKDAGEHLEHSDPGFVPARLPDVVCQEPPWDKSLPAMCDWASSVDAVFRAEVSSIDVVTTDFEISVGPRQGQVQDNCDGGSANYALLLHLWNWETLLGEVPHGPIDVRVGRGQVSEWYPSYRGESPQEMEWRLASNDDGPQPLLPGTVLGVAATRTADGSIWSLYLAPPFTFSADGQTVVPEISPCLAGIAPKLPDIGGMPFSELKQALGKCVPSADGGLRDQRIARFPEPYYSYASSCLLPMDDEK